MFKVTQYKVRQITPLGCTVLTDTGYVLRVGRYELQGVLNQLPKEFNGVYVLYGRGFYYVGQGNIPQRLTAHINNPDKYFSRIYIFWDENEHLDRYLMDLEGYVDRYLQQLGIKSLNKVTTTQPHLTEELTHIVNEWLQILNMVDPTFQDIPDTPIVTTDIKIKQPVEEDNSVIESDELIYQQQRQDLELDTELSKDDLIMLHKILHKSSQVNSMDVVELSQRTGLVDITNKGYKVKPVFQVDVVDKQLIINDPIRQLTQQQTEEIHRVFSQDTLYTGQLVKDDTIPKRIYNLLVESKQLIQGHQKNIYYVSDALADKLSELYEEEVDTYV